MCRDRYDKLVANYFVFIKPASSRIWLRESALMGFLGLMEKIFGPAT